MHPLFTAVFVIFCCLIYAVAGWCSVIQSPGQWDGSSLLVLVFLTYCAVLSVAGIGVRSLLSRR